MKYTLYGDGIHDDTAAIQERIDSRVCEVVLPAPKAFYRISAPLELPSNFRLVLPRFAEIRLADGSNCVMVRNKVVYDHAKRLSPDVYDKPIQRHIWGYCDDFSPDAPCHNIELCGGIWNYNNRGQLPNSQAVKDYDYSVRECYGYAMLFYNVQNLTLRNMTLKDPTTYGVNMEKVSYFTVENIDFDYNDGNPYPVNMDGIHLNGNCHHGVIRNLKGRCYDDLVALNAHEGIYGDITNIVIDGIFAENCHSAVRLLLVEEHISHIHISNVYGSYYQYVIGVTKFYPGKTTGGFDCLTFDNIYVSKCAPVRKGDFQQPPQWDQCSPVIYASSETVIGSMTIRSLHRRERVHPRETVYIGRDTPVERLIIEDVTTTNETDQPMPFLRNRGLIRYLSMRNTDFGQDPAIVGEGRIEVSEGI